MKNHEEVVRSVFERRDAEMKKRKTTLRTALIAGVILCLLTVSVVAVLMIGKKNNPGVSTESEPLFYTRDEGHTYNSEGETSESEDEPYNTVVGAWYLPGALNVRTVMRENDVLQPMARMVLRDPVEEPVRLTGVSEGKFPGTVGARFVDVSGLLEKSQHKDHGSVLFDTEKNELVCLTCRIREVLEKNGILTDELIVVDLETQISKISFALFNEKENRISRRYVLDTDAGTLTEMPVLSSNDTGALLCAPDMKHLLTFAPRKTNIDYDDVFVIDTATGEYRQIAAGMSTFYSGMFSPDGKNILLLLKNEYGVTNGFNSERCRFILWNIETDANCECAGKVLSFLNESVVTTDGTTYSVYDLRTCEKIPQPDGYVAEIDGKTAYRVNLSTGEKNVLCRNADLMMISPDGKYFYSYRTTETHLKCDLIASENYECFYVELPWDFVSEVWELKAGGAVDLFYQPQLSDAMDELLVCYYTVQKGPDDDPAITEQNERESRMRAALWNAYTASSDLKGLYERLRATADFDGYGFTAYEKGNDLASLAVTYGHSRIVFVEDYRDHSFTGYYHDLEAMVISPYEREAGDRRIVPCASTPEQAKAFFAENGFKLLKQEIDYADFYENGVFDEKQAEELRYTDAFLQNISYYSCFLWGNPGFESRNIAKLSEFLKEFRDCDRKLTKAAMEPDVYGMLQYGTIRMLAERGTNGKFYIEAAEDRFEVPEYVFADLVGLCASVNLAPLGGLAEPQTSLAKQFAGNNETKEKLTLSEIVKLWISGTYPTQTLQKYRSVVLSEQNSGLIRVLFPVYGAGEEPECFVIAGFDINSGSLRKFVLFDGNYRFLANLLYGEKPSVKGRMTFDAWTFREPGGHFVDSYESARTMILKTLESIEDDMGYQSFGMLGAKLANEFSVGVHLQKGAAIREDFVCDLWEGALLAGATETMPASASAEYAYVFFYEADLLLILRPVAEHELVGDTATVCDFEVVEYLQMNFEELNAYYAEID